MGLSEHELRKLVQNARTMQHEVLLTGRDLIDDESIGFVQGDEIGSRILEEMLRRVPVNESPVEQAAYLVRAIACLQMFNEGNKRFAVVFANYWLHLSELRLEADESELAKFMLDVVSTCPGIPLGFSLLSKKDNLYNFVLKWLETHIANII